MLISFKFREKKVKVVCPHISVLLFFCYIFLKRKIFYILGLLSKIFNFQLDYAMSHYGHPMRLKDSSILEVDQSPICLSDSRP